MVHAERLKDGIEQAVKEWPEDTGTHNGIADARDAHIHHRPHHWNDNTDKRVGHD